MNTQIFPALLLMPSERSYFDRTSAEAYIQTYVRFCHAPFHVKWTQLTIWPPVNNSEKPANPGAY